MAFPELRQRTVLVGVLLGTLVAVADARADALPMGGCALRPIENVQAAQARTRRWAETVGLAAYDSDRSALTIDRNHVRLTLRFSVGELTVGWKLDDACRPDAIAIQASGDYTGVRPDEVAVRRLAAELAAVVSAKPVAAPYVPGRTAKATPRARLGLGAAVLAAGLLVFVLQRFRKQVTASRRWLRERLMQVARVLMQAARVLLRVARVLLARASAMVRACRALLVDAWRVLRSGIRAGACALGTGLVSIARALRTRAVAIASRVRATSAPTWMRAIGLLAIVVLLPYGVPWSGSGSEGSVANAAVLTGVFSIVAFLWLCATGTFGWASPRRSDWPAIPAFLLAIVMREGIARHAIGDNELYFFYGVFRHRHSVVHPLLGMFLQPLARDPYAWMMHVNGVLGALATLPLFLFVRRRTKREVNAFLVAVFFAVHPIIVQMAPTDLPYSLLFFAWFAGLALLSVDSIGARELIGGSVLLGIAATCRMEGTLFLAVSLLLLDLRHLVSAARAHRAAAWAGAGALVALVAVHAYFCLPAHLTAGAPPPWDPPGFWKTLRAGLLPYDYAHPLFCLLVVTGVVVGSREPQVRIGLGAGLGVLLVVWPFVDSTDASSFLSRHRLVPACALQTIAAGVGAAWFARTLSFSHWWNWATLLPGLAIAFMMFDESRHEMTAPNALTDEFWMLREQLAPGGKVKQGCSLLSLGAREDTDLCDFSQVLPGMRFVRCEHEDCLRIASESGCYYYLRSLNCFYRKGGTPLQCRERGRTASGDHLPCMDPRCVQIESALGLSLVEERRVDVHGAFPDIAYPRTADLGLYRVRRPP